MYVEDGFSNEIQNLEMVEREVGQRWIHLHVMGRKIKYKTEEEKRQATKVVTKLLSKKQTTSFR